ncbi:hypothetical protein J2X14_003909 [Pantoea alhagi]|uniref:DUF4926 domain-containing protein n=1 Tax=Mixta sp. BE291 TaxID=3158787 RepID=UPI002862A636|nr:hypothetical protein [Pantoea alhagi]
MLNEYDVVKAKRELSDKVLQGTRGAIVLVYEDPVLGYEVEFVDNKGDSLSVLTVCPNDIELLK